MKNDEKSAQVRAAYTAGKLSRPPLWRSVLLPIMVSAWWAIPFMAPEVAGRAAICPLATGCILVFGLWAAAALVASPLEALDDHTD